MGCSFTSTRSAWMKILTRKDFDALDIFRKQFSSSIDSRLMSWYVDDKVR